MVLPTGVVGPDFSPNHSSVGSWQQATAAYCSECESGFGSQILGARGGQAASGPAFLFNSGSAGAHGCFLWPPYPRKNSVVWGGFIYKMKTLFFFTEFVAVCSDFGCMRYFIIFGITESPCKACDSTVLPQILFLLVENNSF